MSDKDADQEAWEQTYCIPLYPGTDFEDQMSISLHKYEPPDDINRGLAVWEIGYSVGSDDESSIFITSDEIGSLAQVLKEISDSYEVWKNRQA